MLGQGASYEFRWRRWALMRDAIVAHLEGHQPGSRFPQFAAIGNALGVDAVHLPATELAAELREIRSGLAKLTVDELVLGPPTAMVLYPGVQLDTARLLTRAELAHVAPIADAKTLAEYFSTMLESMLHVCDHPADDGTIEVVDG